jgi:hypothetical protein
MSLVEMIAMTNSLDVQEVIEMKTQVRLLTGDAHLCF